MRRLKNFFRTWKIFFRGPRFNKGIVIRYAGVLYRISNVGFVFKTAEWRYRIEGSSMVHYSEAQVAEMRDDHARFVKRHMF